MKLITLMSLILMISCSEEKHDMDHSKMTQKAEQTMSAQQEMTTKVNKAQFNDPILDGYFMIQETFVNDSKEGVDVTLASMKSALEKSNHEMKEKLLMAVDAMMKAPDLKEMRIAFSPLSQMMITYVKSSTLSSDLYVMHCPMAFNNTGADWLQNSDKLYNPYFGSKMLRCGSTKETLAAK